VNSANKSSAPPPDDTDDTDNIPDTGELVYGVFNNLEEINVFRYSDFSSSSIIKETIDSQDYIFYGNYSKQIINAFKVSNADNYVALNEEFPFILIDSNGIKNDIFGRGNNGVSLEKPKYAYVAVWRAWDDFFDNFIFQ